MTDVAYLPVLARGLPPAPDPALDPYLDAAETCISQHGVTRTSLGDIAKVLGVSRTTVYRQLGSIDNVIRLIAARELQRFHQTVPAALAGAGGPEGVVRVLAALITLAQQNPVAAKILRDEPGIMGEWLAAGAVETFQQVADMLLPTLEVAIAAGLIRKHNPVALAHWIARISAALIVAPPPVDIKELLDDMLLPILEPERRRAR
jgi:AcrR family transcriptional regulator